MFAGTLSIPYLTRTGVVGIKFRSLDPEAKPKYLWPSGARSHLYNVNAIFEASDSIALTEGELDAITLHHLCGIPAVGIAGTQHWKPHFPRLFEGFQHIWVFADNDKREDGSNPGRDLARKIIEDLPQSTLVHLEPGEDTNSTYIRHGRDHIRSLIGLE